MRDWLPSGATARRHAAWILRCGLLSLLAVEPARASDRTEALVEGLYQTVLGRAASREEIASWPAGSTGARRQTRRGR